MPAAPIVETLVPVLLEKPHAVVIQFEDGASLTAEALLARAEQFAAYVSKRVPRGTPIAVAMGNRAEFFIIWLALLGTGHPMVNMNPALTQTEAEHMLRDSRSAWVLAEQQTSQLFRSAQTKCPDLSEVLILGEQEPDGLLAFCDEDDSFDLLSAPPSIHDTTFITYTSGTTGMPKGCAHLQGETCRYVDVVGRLYDLRSTDSFLNPLQFFYGDSIWLFALSLKLGAPFVSMRKFSVNRFWSVVQQFETTVLLGIGAIPNLLLKREPTTDEQNHTMRMALQIGVPPRHHRELVERFGFPWYDVYGLSETGLNLAMPPHLADSYIGTGAIGLPVPEVDVEIVDRAGLPLTGETIGELAVSGPFMMAGYLNNPQETANVTLGRFLRTGDEISRDADGMHFFRGRLKEVIRRGGENIAPFEVEAVIRSHPAVHDVAVVPVPDDLRGEEGKAYVEFTGVERVDFSELVNFCTERLAPHKIPRYYELRDRPFPRTPSQRIRKAQLKVAGVHALDDVWDRTEMRVQ